MHEAHLLSAAVAVLAERSGEPVRHVTLAIAHSVDIEAARSAWTQASAGTMLAAAELTFVLAQDTLTCLGCGHEYPGDRLTRCPECHDDGLVSHPAHELEIADWT